VVRYLSLYPLFLASYFGGLCSIAHYKSTSPLTPLLAEAGSKRPMRGCWTKELSLTEWLELCHQTKELSLTEWLELCHRTKELSLIEWLELCHRTKELSLTEWLETMSPDQITEVYFDHTVKCMLDIYTDFDSLKLQPRALHALWSMNDM
jgi:hypothetical protein